MKYVAPTNSWSALLHMYLCKPKDWDKILIFPFSCKTENEKLQFHIWFSHDEGNSVADRVPCDFIYETNETKYFV